MNVIRLARPCLLALLAPLALAGADPSPRPIQDPLRPEPLALGEVLPAHATCRDLRGNLRSLAEFEGYRAYVLVFVSTTCPLANLYLPRLVELSRAHEPRTVKFIAVYPNALETVREIAGHGDDKGLPFLQALDIDARLAARLGVERTPQAVVLDAARALRYRGRIDDQYGVAARRAAPTRGDLAEALSDVLAGAEVRVAETPADGCLIETERAPLPEREITFSRDVAPILQRRCEPCHREGQIGPFPLATYQDALRKKRMLAEVVVERRMPPWQADPRHGVFANDRSLSAAEVETVRAWVERGAPQGDPAELPPPVAWPTGWSAQPDVVLELPEAIDVPATGVMDYINVAVPTTFDEDVWIQSAEILPGDPSVLHHVAIFINPADSRRPASFGWWTRVLVNWVPGAGIKVNPEGTATRLPKGAQLFWQLHYTPNGTATRDRTALGLVLADGPPERETNMSVFMTTRFRIDPFGSHQVHRSALQFSEDARLISLRPHMHLRGKAFKYELLDPAGSAAPVTVLSVPAWDFNWQTEYFFEEPLAVRAGLQLMATAVWDNSDNNLGNPDPTATVTYGEQTFEEMMNGWVKYVPEDPAVNGARLVGRVRAVSPAREGQR